MAQVEDRLECNGNTSPYCILQQTILQPNVFIVTDALTDSGLQLIL